jgi:cytochrome c oxidase subunit IV
METHVLPTRLYVGIFLALLLGTALTVAASFVDFGGRLNSANVLVAMSIAVSKGLLVVLFFMHVRYSARLIWVFVAAGAFWLALLIGLTLSDFLTRGWLPVPAPWVP